MYFLPQWITSFCLPERQVIKAIASSPEPGSGGADERADGPGSGEVGKDDARDDAGEQTAAGEPREAEGDAEARQAMEQWMRRIPDDPGGLLRRKFALEHRRRGGAGAAGAAW